MRFIILSLILLSPLSVFGDQIFRDATYYSDNFEGGFTSNGDVFSQSHFSAALCGTDLGQYLYVHTSSTGVVVRANDRPNCKKYPNLIDLSQSAFQLFSPVASGKIPNIAVDILAPVGNDNQMKGFIPTSSFSSLGVLLDSPVPNIFFSGDGIEISGRVVNNEKYALLYMKNKNTGETFDSLIRVDSVGKFMIRFALPKNPGNYIFILAGGQSFQTDRFTEVTLLDRNLFQYPTNIPTLSGSSWNPKIESRNKLTTIGLPQKTWAEITLTQEKKVYKTSGTALILNPDKFLPGTANVQIHGYTLSTPSSLDRSLKIPSFFSGSVFLDYISESIGSEKITLLNTGKNTLIRGKIPSNVKIRDSYFLTLPSGEVHEFPFPSGLIGEDGFLKPNIKITLPLNLSSIGTYRLEFVQSDGLAYINIPITRGMVWNILSPNLPIKKRNLSSATFFSSQINIIRASLGKNLLLLDDELSSLAQGKVNDMLDKGYVGHISPDGLDILEFSKKKGFIFSGAIGENIASGNVSDPFLQKGLEDSGSHRMNMLRSEWKKIGIGYAIKNGQTYVVQIFGE
ncbi:hypothetical protein KBB25_01380 [Candidatus Gracilibacteria bacterium]|nr:hypothetical protein [Candidatus Gracilibacteria bacterium]